MTRSRMAASGDSCPSPAPPSTSGTVRPPATPTMWASKVGQSTHGLRSRTFMGSFQRLSEILAPTCQAASDLEQLRIVRQPHPGELDQTLAEAARSRRARPCPSGAGARLDVDHEHRATDRRGRHHRPRAGSLPGHGPIGGTGSPKPRDYAAGAGPADHWAGRALTLRPRHGLGRGRPRARRTEALPHPIPRLGQADGGGPPALHRRLHRQPRHGERGGTEGQGLRRPSASRRSDSRTPWRWPTNGGFARSAQATLDDQQALGKAVKDYREFERQWWTTPATSGARSSTTSSSTASCSREPRTLDGRAGRVRARPRHGRGVHRQQRCDPRRLAEAIFHETNLAMHSSGGHVPLIDEEEWLGIVHDANDEVNNLRQQGYDVNYVPVPRPRPPSVKAATGRASATRPRSRS